MMFQTDFLVERAELKWADILWGYKHRLIGWRIPVAIANSRMTESPYHTLLVQLAELKKDADWRVGKILEALANSDSSSEEASHSKWLFLALLWLYENREGVENVFDALRQVYVEFGYPDAISAFIPFMPPNDGYDPTAHTSEENRARIFLKWEEFLFRTNAGEAGLSEG